MIEVDDLRGTIGDWGNGRRDIGSLGEDDIFDRFYPQAGLALSFYIRWKVFLSARHLMLIRMEKMAAIGRRTSTRA